MFKILWQNLAGDDRFEVVENIGELISSLMPHLLSLQSGYISNLRIELA